MEQRSVTVIENISSPKDGLSFLVSPMAVCSSGKRSPVQSYCN